MNYEDKVGINPQKFKVTLSNSWNNPLNRYDENYKYKGFYYNYDSINDRWNIYNNYYTGSLFMFCAKKYRLDQCFLKLKRLNII